MLPPATHGREDDRPELDAFLEARIDDGNARATDIYDGTSLNASVVDDEERQAPRFYEKLGFR